MQQEAERLTLFTTKAFTTKAFTTKAFTTKARPVSAGRVQLFVVEQLLG